MCSEWPEEKTELYSTKQRRWRAPTNFGIGAKERKHLGDHCLSVWFGFKVPESNLLEPGRSQYTTNVFPGRIRRSES